MVVDVRVGNLLVDGIVTLLHWQNVLSEISVIVRLVTGLSSIEVEEDVKDLAVDVVTLALSIAEIVVNTVYSLSRIAYNIAASHIGDILDDVLVEIHPDSVRDQETREHSVNDSEVRVLIIERCTINGRAVHDILNANSPGAIITLSFILSEELKETIECLVRVGVTIASTQVNLVITDIQESGKLLYEIGISFIDKTKNELSPVVIAAWNDSTHTEKTVNPSYIEVFLFSDHTE